MSDAPPWRLERHDRLPSTNDSCIERAEAGEAAGLAIQARVQTRPRGSRGRSWQEAGGNLALSVLLRPEHRAAWPLIAGLALHDALCLEPDLPPRLRLKWPNDILLDGAKLAGILIESSLDATGSGWLVIGFGANLLAAPEIEGRRTACLAEQVAAPDADRIADRLLASLSGWYGLAHDTARVRQAWLARAHPRGTKLAVDGVDGQTTGSFFSLAEDGALLLEVAGEIRRITMGEAYLIQGA